MERLRPLLLLGFMGSGKTTVGRRAAALAEADFWDLDRVIEEDAGRSIPEVFRLEGEAGFRRREAVLLHQALARTSPDSRAIVAVGGGTPMNDASWAAMREAALTVWLDAPLPELLRRADSASRPVLQGRTAAELEALYRARARRYREADHRVDGGAPVEQVAREVVRLWDA
ncbi:MAG: shikimate kinase [Candidatus Dormibacteraceae bacterium]